METNYFKPRGSRAIVTGGCSGMGRAIAEAYHQAGIQVAILDVNPGVGETAKSMGAGVCGIQANLAEEKVREEAFRKAVEQLGGLDILVNCAGIQYDCPSEEFPLEMWHKVLEVNLTAVFHLCQLAGEVMLPRKSGRIINFASMLSYIGGLTVPAYSATKGGVAQLTKTLSNEWCGRGVNVNAIAPGYIDTPLNAAMMENKPRAEQILARIAMGRWGKPEDVCGTALYLISPASDYVSGVTIPVDGGFLAN